MKLLLNLLNSLNAKFNTSNVFGGVPFEQERQANGDCCVDGTGAIAGADGEIHRYGY